MLYLHIGRNKTATSYLQRFLCANRLPLARQRRHYPAPRQADGFGHHDFAQALQGRVARIAEGSDPSAVTDDYAAELKAHENPVVSSELFQNIDPQLLTPFIVPERTVIVVYLREQVAYLRSAYAQMVHAQNYVLGFEAFAKSHWADHEALLRRWSQCFPEQQLSVGSVDQLRAQGVDIAMDFLRRIGVRQSEDFTRVSGASSTSLNPTLVLLKRFVNRNVTPTEHARSRLYELFQNVNVSRGSRRKWGGVSAGFVEQTRQQYAAGNQVVCDRYFGGTSADSVFPVDDAGGDGEFEPGDLAFSLVKIDRTNPSFSRSLRRWLADFDRSRLSREEAAMVAFADATIRRQWTPATRATDPGTWTRG